MNQYVIKEIDVLLKTSIDLKEIGHHLWFEYSPHVNSIDLRLYIGGWDNNKKHDYSKTIYLDEFPEYLFNKDKCIKEIIKSLKQAKKDIDKIISKT